MVRAMWYVIAVLFVVAMVVAAGQVSLQSTSCMACHDQEASYADWMKKKLKAEKKGFSHEMIACADCHIEGAAAGTLMSRFRGLLHVATYIVPQIDPRRPQVGGLFTKTRIPSENCQYCHLAAIQRKAVQVRDLTPGLKQIGLAMDHRKHVLARDDTCARCHERYKTAEADRMVTYTEVNHLSCDACHTRASHAYRAGQLLPLNQKEFLLAREEAWKSLSTNPRWMVPFPTEQSCRRCHNGNIHYKTKIFIADCNNDTNFENCVKCHPQMTREYFEQHRREREKKTATSNTPQEPAHGGPLARVEGSSMAGLARPGLGASDDPSVRLE